MKINARHAPQAQFTTSSFRDAQGLKIAQKGAQLKNKHKMIIFATLICVVAEGVPGAKMARRGKIQKSRKNSILRDFGQWVRGKIP